MPVFKDADLSVKFLTQDDIPQLIATRNEILSLLPHPDLYVREEDELGFLQFHCGEHGKTIGLFDGDRLIGYAMLGFPNAFAPDNMARMVGLPLAHWGHVAHFASCMIHPDYRGRGLQRSLVFARLDLARLLGLSTCLAMVSPHNHASRDNLFRQGFHLVWSGMIETRRRHILMRNLDDSPPQAPLEPHQVVIHDFEAQSILLNQGFVGVAQDHTHDKTLLTFIRHRSSVFPDIATQHM